MALVELESVPRPMLAMVALCLLQEHRLSLSQWELHDSPNRGQRRKEPEEILQCPMEVSMEG